MLPVVYTEGFGFQLVSLAVQSSCTILSKSSSKLGFVLNTALVN